MKPNTDIFHWANNVDGSKDELQIDMFVFSKNYTPYSLSTSPKLDGRIRQLFLVDVISTIETGAATGMAIRDIQKQDTNENALDFVELEKVQNAQSVIELIQFGEETLEIFSEEDHSIRRMRGIVARFRYKDKRRTPFFIIKYLQASASLPQSAALEIDANNMLDDMKAHAAISIKGGFETLIVKDTVFVFNERKFVQTFNYDAKKRVELDGKIAELNKHYKLAFPEGLSMYAIAYENASLADSLLRCNPGLLTQDQIIEQADEFGLALMTDDSNAIIIMDKRDASMFANLLNDDYLESNGTGAHYLAIKKKEVLATEDKQLHTGL